MTFTVKHTSIRLANLRFYAFHGLLPAERVVGGEFLVDVTLHLSAPMKAMLRDDISDTINYAAVNEEIINVMQQPCNLLERVAYRIMQRLYDRFSLVTAIDLSVTKVKPPMIGQNDGAIFTISSQR